MKASLFLKNHTTCCFCGGNEIATTVEHLPARIVFPRKHRPKGFEFPSCGLCNSQTKGADAMLSLVARTLGSMRPSFPDFDLETIQKVAGGMHINFPGFRLAGQEVLHNVNGVIRKVGVVDVNRPEVDESLCKLAAKFALAAHYDLTRIIADETFRINTFWTHNQRPGSSEIADILRQFPNSSSLKQGRWDTAETFFFRHVHQPPSLIVAAVFYESLLLYAQIGPASEAQSWKPLQMVWAPKSKHGLVIASLTASTGSPSAAPS